MSETDQACENTDQRIWPIPKAGNVDAYSDSLFITEGGALGIDCGGYVVVKPIRDWHALARTPAPDAVREALEIERVTDAIIGKMFAPHELPVDDELRSKYRGTAVAAPNYVVDTTMGIYRPSEVADEAAGAPELKITDEMIEAGVAAISGFELLDAWEGNYSRAELVILIYSAMSKQL